MKTLIIAEIGTSHEGDINKAKALIEAANEAGADCIKFQWVYADEILHPKTGFVNLPTGKIPLYERFKQLEVPTSFFIELQNYVRSHGKTFMCSPFGIRSLEELFAIKPDFIKIASPELNHTPMLKKLVELELNLPKQERIPVIISTGVSKLSDILYSLEILEVLKHDNLVSLLHCVTSYPAPPEDYNLKLLETYKKDFNIDVGVSDHSRNPILVPSLSIACGGNIIEKHITLSNDTLGLDDPVALEPITFKNMVDTVRKYEELEKKDIVLDLEKTYDKELIRKTLGTGKKKLAKSEEDNYGRTNRSIHIMHNMKKGEVITEKDIAVLRTEKILSVGMHPDFYDKVIGKTLIKDICGGEGLTEDFLKIF